MTDGQLRESVFLERIRAGDPDVWAEFIRTYEGRLFAFIEPRVADHATAEDLVQETLTGFLLSLPNFDGSRSLESWLFAIAAHKLTDHLRRQQRNEVIGLGTSDSEKSRLPLAAKGRGPSTILASREAKRADELRLVQVLTLELDNLRRRGEWRRLSCLELLFLAGRPNKEVAALLDITEQQVANWKFDFLQKLRKHLGSGLPEGMLPKT